MIGRTAILIFGLATLGALGGCTVSTAGQPSASNADAGAGASAADAGAPPLGCLGILSCVTKNACSTNDCVDACLAQGTPDAQKQVTDLATCNQNASCSDSACLLANCKKELDACLAGSAPPATGSPLQSGSAPAGSVPADFVGTWMAGNTFDLTSSREFKFDAGGTGLYLESYNGGLGQCSSAVVAKYQGAAVIDGSAGTITIYATTVEEITNTCGSPTTKTNPAKTLRFTYTPNSLNDGLLITDSDCAAQHTAQNDANLYCRYTYRKQ